jgi:hypothetical protein
MARLIVPGYERGEDTMYYGRGLDNIVKAADVSEQWADLHPEQPWMMNGDHIYGRCAEVLLRSYVDVDILLGFKED